MCERVWPQFLVLREVEEKSSDMEEKSKGGGRLRRKTSQGPSALGRTAAETTQCGRGLDGSGGRHADMLRTPFHQVEMGLSVLPSTLCKRGRATLPPGGCRITSSGHEEWWAVAGSERQLVAEEMVAGGGEGFCRPLSSSMLHSG